MKKYFTSKTLIALAVAIAAAASYDSLANEQPMPPPANGSALPENILPGTPAAEVVKLAQAGVDASVIQTYISNCPNAFNLDADKIISLTDAGVSSDMVNAMIAHDKTYLASLAPATPPEPSSPPAPAPTASSDSSSTTAPTTDMTLNDFNNTLAPYGQWVEVAGYGRCWRPTAVAYDATWQPYCDRGQWVYTDCGWYWNSDYSWGVTFHYGRWFRSANYGWCWWPDTVWAPSWVTWRSSGDYCGWAPLPPYTAYQPGIGFTYHGGNVSVGFGFGLNANCFTFVSLGHFCEPHPRNYCVPPQQITQIYNQTTIINNYNSHNRTIINNGVSVTVIGAAAHHPIQAVSIGTLVNADRHGWRGQSVAHPAHPFGADTSNGSAVRQSASTGGNGVGSNHYSTVNAPAQKLTTPANNFSPAHNPSHNDDSAASIENHPAARTYVAPAATTTVPGNWSPATSQHSQPRSDLIESPRQMATQPAFTAPSATDGHPQPSDWRQNYGQTETHNLTPAVPKIASPAPTQNVAPGNSGHFPNWAAQNH
jgi:hypothetical protein